METEYVVGEGVLNAMSAAGDEPRSDERYVIQGEGATISETFGRDAIYYWYEKDNTTHRLPFD